MAARKDAASQVIFHCGWFEITTVKQFHVAATDVISGPDLFFQPGND